MTPERIAELRQHLGSVGLQGPWATIAECLDAIEALQRELERQHKMATPRDSDRYFIRKLEDERDRYRKALATISQLKLNAGIAPSIALAALEEANG